MDFFNDCKTQEDVKSTFKRLCKHFHPDKGGEESLMIELKKQYDNWNPSFKPNQFNFTVNTNGFEEVYEKKINELNRIIYHLRNDIEILRSSYKCQAERGSAETSLRCHYQQEMRKQKDYIDILEMKLETKTEQLKEKENMQKNMSLKDKISFVMGYE